MEEMLHLTPTPHGCNMFVLLMHGCVQNTSRIIVLASFNSFEAFSTFCMLSV